ncbi:type 4a pilus biogenesis protein PilO [Thauera aromatica]|uniref:type 4a pilus biogenesis protein PilO n=1 Tax=Thauera aromatica TaxID=59405 RepID=UPI001FFC6A06|nr:type 4a pilus biogenesis protein PilO [Thauera aromatica]MCK2089583.1 type 4a pilus biogenesis protein PilO [Thauera aromatica]MCK2125198.1 type 4a pilus biogenesis protein PilO [Thauera aromatica]
MKALWLSLLQRIDARSLRERVMLLVVALAAVVALADTLFIDAARRAHGTDQARLADAHARLTALQAQEAELQARLAVDPDAGVKARLGALRRELSQADTRLAAAVARFISATEMSRVLRALVTRTGGLRLEGLRSLPPSPIDTGAVAAAKDAPGGTTREAGKAGTDAARPNEARTQVWKRGVELQLRGDYGALLAYLRAVEQLPWQLNWDLLSVHSERHLEAEFILRLHTLSLEEDWIGV